MIFVFKPRDFLGIVVFQSIGFGFVIGFCIANDVKTILHNVNDAPKQFCNLFYSMFLFRDSAASLFQSLQTQYYRITLAFQTLLFNNGIQFIADLWSDPNMIGGVSIYDN